MQIYIVESKHKMLIRELLYVFEKHFIFWLIKKVSYMHIFVLQILTCKYWISRI